MERAEQENAEISGDESQDGEEGMTFNEGDMGKFDNGKNEKDDDSEEDGAKDIEE
jgi:hypothetical protein